MRGNQLNPARELSQTLFQGSSLRKQGQKPKKEQRILLLLPISNIINIIIIIINIKKISKKATLDQACIIIVINQDIGSRNVESGKQQHQTKNTERKGEALIGAMSAKYNLEASSDAWHMESGAAEHMLNRREWFSSYKKFDTVENIKIGDGKYIQAIGSGDIDILVFNGKEWEKYLSNIFHVPELSFNLFSAGAVLDKGLRLYCDEKKCTFMKKYCCSGRKKER